MKGKIEQKILLYKIKSFDDTQSFGKLYDLYVDRIFRFIYFKVSDIEDAKDLTSEVFLKIWQYLKGTEKIDNFNALIYQVARNIVIDHYRKHSGNKEITDISVLEKIESHLSEDLIKEIQLRVDMISVINLMKKLKDEYREVIILKYIEQYSTKEISKIIDKPKGAVKVLAHRALKRLQSMAEEQNTKGNEN